MEHRLLGGRPVYSIYGQLATVADDLRAGACVVTGAPIGTIGDLGAGAGDAFKTALRLELRKTRPRSDGEKSEPWETTAPAEWIGKVQVRDGNSEEFRLPGGRAPLHPVGALLKTRESHDIYLVRARRMLLRVPERSLLPRLYANGGFGPEHVIVVSGDELRQYRLAGTAQVPLPANGAQLPEGTLIRDPKTRMAVVTENGGRREFRSLGAFEGLGYSFCNAVALGEEEFHSYRLEQGAIDGADELHSNNIRESDDNVIAEDEFTRLEEDQITKGAPIEGRTPLILIHGIDGNRVGDEDHAYNPNRYYFQRLLEFLASFDDEFFKDRFKVYRFHYVSNQEVVEYLADRLRDLLDDGIRNGRIADTDFLLLAHSMGGLVARSYMNQHDHNAGDRAGKRAGYRVRSLITLATPHHGTPLANEKPRVRSLLDLHWELFLDLADCEYWRSCSISITDPNRRDFLWDNFDNLWRAADYRGDEVNDWLRGLNNPPSEHDAKIIPYWGKIGRTPLTEELAGAGASDLGSRIKEFYGAGDMRGALAGLGVVLERIMRSSGNPESNRMDDVPKEIAQDVQNDGILPTGSAAFDGPELLRIECPSHDHFDMRDGTLRRCENSKLLLRSVLDDLMAAALSSSAPTTPTLESLAVSPDTVVGGASAAGTIRLSSPAGADGVLVRLSANSGLVTLPRTLTVPEGSIESSFPIQSSPVAADEPVVVAAISSSAFQSAELRLVPDIQHSTSVGVPATATIVLAGLPDGRDAWGDKSPQNSPVEVPLSLAPGQVLQLAASGLVALDRRASLQVSADGDPERLPRSSVIGEILGGSFRSFGIGKIRIHFGALIGMLLGPGPPEVAKTPPDVNFASAAQDMVTLTPLLQQPFFVGRGITAAGSSRNIVVPAGATRLFLAVFDENGRSNDNAGQFQVTVVSIPPPPPPVFPMVPATASIGLAGQPDGLADKLVAGGDGTPLNSPVLAPITLAPGQVLQFKASGLADIEGKVDLQTSPDGDPARLPSSSIVGAIIEGTFRNYGIARIRAPLGALTGVFLGPDPPDMNRIPPDVNYASAARDLITLTPLTQQPFLIGRGSTAAGSSRNVVVPTGASRLFLGVLDEKGYNNDNRGYFQITITAAESPPPPIYPTVPATSSIVLAGQPEGKASGYDGSPLNSPVLAPVSFNSGQTLQFTATGAVDVSGRAQPQTPPEGETTTRRTTGSLMYGSSREFGIAEITGPAGALVGVFLGPDPPDPRTAPPNVDYFGTNRDSEALSPLLHQPFLIGRGVTPSGSTRRVTAPAGATRLFLGVLDEKGYNNDNTGRFNVTVTVQ